MIFETDEPLNGCSASLPDTMACLLQSAIDDACKLDRTVYFPHHEHWRRAITAPTCTRCAASPPRRETSASTSTAGKGRTATPTAPGPPPSDSTPPTPATRSSTTAP